jgi:hypothetical protein
MNKHTGLAALRGWRGALADRIVPPVARDFNRQETLRASVGFLFLALSALLPGLYRARVVRAA